MFVQDMAAGWVDLEAMLQFEGDDAGVRGSAGLFSALFRPVQGPLRSSFLRLCTAWKRYNRR